MRIKHKWIRDAVQLHRVILPLATCPTLVTTFRRPEMSIGEKIGWKTEMKGNYLHLGQGKWQPGQESSRQSHKSRPECSKTPCSISSLRSMTHAGHHIHFHYRLSPCYHRCCSFWLRRWGLHCISQSLWLLLSCHWRGWSLIRTCYSHPLWRAGCSEPSAFSFCSSFLPETGPEKEKFKYYFLYCTSQPPPSQDPTGRGRWSVWFFALTFSQSRPSW